MPLTQVTEADWQQEVLQHDRMVLVDFYAQWCPPCRALAPLLDRFAEEHADRIKVVKVDADADEDLASRYGVRTIPTLISFKSGEEVARAINPQSRARLEELIQQA
jgi:thioredoxin 1